MEKQRNRVGHLSSTLWMLFTNGHLAPVPCGMPSPHHARLPNNTEPRPVLLILLILCFLNDGLEIVMSDPFHCTFSINNNKVLTFVFSVVDQTCGVFSS